MVEIRCGVWFSRWRVRGKRRLFLCTYMTTPRAAHTRTAFAPFPGLTYALEGTLSPTLPKPCEKILYIDDPAEGKRVYDGVSNLAAHEVFTPFWPCCTPPSHCCHPDSSRRHEHRTRWETIKVCRSFFPPCAQVENNNVNVSTPHKSFILRSQGRPNHRLTTLCAAVLPPAAPTGKNRVLQVLGYPVRYTMVTLRHMRDDKNLLYRKQGRGLATVPFAYSLKLLLVFLP